MYAYMSSGFDSVQMAEVRQTDRPYSSRDLWAFPTPSWLTSTLAQLERVEHGPNAAGIGDFRDAVAAANAIRAIVKTVTLQSLPFPEVVPASGGAIVAIWRNGDRVLELAAFPDTTTVFERLENGQEVPEEHTLASSDKYFLWLGGKS